MSYTTEEQVYDRTGFNNSIIEELSGKSTSEVTDLINDYITDATERIRTDIDYPIRIVKELHLGDGDRYQFELGPYDDPYAEEGDYDPEGGLIEIYNAWFGRLRMRKPYPEDCELGTELDDPDTDGWTGNNVTITAEQTIKASGTYSVKAVFSDAGYIEYPETSRLDKIIDGYDDVFFWLRTSDSSVTFTLRLYDKDGNNNNEEFTLRQSDIGQYMWLDVDTFSGNVDWNLTRFQYYRLYVDKACTIYFDNFCFADSWAFTAPEGLLHISVSDNISSETPPAYNYPFYVSYSYDPFLNSVPRYIREAAEWLVGIYIVDYLRGIRYKDTSFEVYGQTLELDTDASREGLLGVRTKMEKNYWRCLRNWGQGSYGVV
jgi:hypothetical protein